MSTAIEWTDETWNPVTGCTKVSQGCKNCYAERIWPKVEAAERMREHWEWRKAPKRAFTDVRTHPNRLDAPLHWKKPRRIFVNSMSDLFHEDISDEFIDQVFGVMAITTRHKFQVLTKRPARMLEYIRSRTQMIDDEEGPPRNGLRGCPNVITDASVAARRRTNDHGYDNCGPLWPLENVWLGVSVEDQATADERIQLLLQTPAAVRFLSCEPLLGAIDLTAMRRGPSNDDLALDGRDRIKEYFVDALTGTNGVLMNDGRVLLEPFSRNQINWVIAGGESGPNARPSHPDWFRSLRDQCAAAGVSYFFKQWGEWAPAGSLLEVKDPELRVDTETFQRRPNLLFFPALDYCFDRVGKKAAGRTLDGCIHDEYPA